MDYKAHIRLVDTHSECIRADHHPYLIRLPLLLTVGSGLLSQTCMIERRRHSVSRQKSRQFLSLLTASDIDYSRTANTVADI